MGLTKNEFQTKRMESMIAHIGAVMADAIELSKKMQEIAASSETLFIDAQQKLEELYVLIGEAESDY